MALWTPISSGESNRLTGIFEGKVESSSNRDCFFVGVTVSESSNQEEEKKE